MMQRSSIITQVRNQHELGSNPSISQRKERKRMRRAMTASNNIAEDH
jgi:hypothetical protein